MLGTGAAGYVHHTFLFLLGTKRQVAATDLRRNPRVGEEQSPLAAEAAEEGEEEDDAADEEGEEEDAADEEEALHTAAVLACQAGTPG